MQISCPRIYNINTVKIINSKNPVKMYNMMKLYSRERSEKFPCLQALLHTFYAICTKCKLKAVKDNCGKLLAAYTYKLRKNRKGEKSLYINTLVRKRDIKNSKKIMKDLYNDIKVTAQHSDAKELTLFSELKDTKLQENYEKLGFKKDHKVFIHGGYIMRVRTKDFLKDI